MKRISFLAIFFVIASLGAIHAQQRTGFAYYDLDRLYDTIPSLFYDDTDYTPEGRLRWSGERYRAKVERAGAVIGRMAMPLAGVYGVENEEVVKDLVRASDLPYSLCTAPSIRWTGWISPCSTMPTGSSRNVSKQVMATSASRVCWTASRQPYC